jgi:hypothetical protein
MTVHPALLNQREQIDPIDRLNPAQAKDDVPQATRLLARSHRNLAGNIRMPQRDSRCNGPIDQVITMSNVPNPRARVEEDALRVRICPKAVNRATAHFTGSSGRRRGGTSNPGSTPRILAA